MRRTSVDTVGSLEASRAMIGADIARDDTNASFDLTKKIGRPGGHDRNREHQFQIECAPGEIREPDSQPFAV